MLAVLLFGIANGQIPQLLTVICPLHVCILFQTITFCGYCNFHFCGEIRKNINTFGFELRA